MRYFLDCEFIENGKTIDLISIGVVCSDGREYYAINEACDYRNASQWVWNNVLHPMGFYTTLWCIEWDNPNEVEDAINNKQYVKLPGKIAEELRSFLTEGGTVPEIWGEWCSYDWVAFCQLFGTMMELPKGFPMRCRDVIQYCEDNLKVNVEDLPAFLDMEGNHNALLGARTVKNRFDWLESRENWQKARSQRVPGIDLFFK